MLNDLRLEVAAPHQYPAIYGIMALAGEQMHRVLNLSHWHPFPPTEEFIAHLDGRIVYAVFTGDFLVGTFNLGTVAVPDYQVDMSAYWQDASAPAMFFSSLALLPAYQQQGIGTWCMAQADRIAQEQGFRYMRFYTRLGYRQCGVLQRGDFRIMVFEKDFNPPENPAQSG